MNTNPHGRFASLLNSSVIATLIFFCVGFAPHRANAEIVVYTFQQSEPGLSPFTATGDITVDGGTLVGGELNFNYSSPIPFSSWYQPSWNGSYLTAGIFNTPVGTVLATGPGQPAIQVFNSITYGTTIEGTWVAVPEPDGFSLLLAAIPALGIAVHKRKAVLLKE